MPKRPGKAAGRKTPKRRRMSLSQPSSEGMQVVRNKLFISYSHKDKAYLDRLLDVLKLLERESLIDVWSELCQPRPEAPSPEFRTVYPFVTTVQGNRFRFRGGEPARMQDSLQRLFERHLQGPVQTHLDL